MTKMTVETDYYSLGRLIDALLHIVDEVRVRKCCGNWLIEMDIPPKEAEIVATIVTEMDDYMRVKVINEVEEKIKNMKEVREE